MTSMHPIGVITLSRRGTEHSVVGTPRRPGPSVFLLFPRARCFSQRYHHRSANEVADRTLLEFRSKLGAFFFFCPYWSAAVRGACIQYVQCRWHGSLLGRLLPLAAVPCRYSPCTLYSMRWHRDSCGTCTRIPNQSVSSVASVSISCAPY
jgi:hypothetical protein